MSANADSVRFNFECNVHDWAYFKKKYPFPETHIFYIKLTVVLGRKFLVSSGLGQDISCIQFLVVSDLKVMLKLCKRSRLSESLWVA